MVSPATETLSFERFPFISGLFHSREFTEHIREYLPLTIELRRDLGLVAQKCNSDVDQELERAYKIGSVITTPLGEGDLNASLCAEVLELIDEACDGVAGKRFLEPGCGKAYLLKQLVEQGAAKAVGYEPGPFLASTPENAGVEIINSFFDPSILSEQFDCVYHTMVLEHMKDPEAFLLQNIQVLKDSGVVFLLVPGCEVDLEQGNFMALAHEHYNYFTKQSLSFLMQKAGLVKIQIRQCSYSQGIICAWGSKAAGNRFPPVKNPSAKHIEEESTQLRTFTEKSLGCLASLQQRADTLAQNGKSLGLYGSPRALAGLLNFGTAPRNFDGDSAKHGKFFSGSPNPIESPQTLRREPVDELWVLPIHHDRAIRKYLGEEILPYQDIEVFSLLEFLTNYLGATSDTTGHKESTACPT